MSADAEVRFEPVELSEPDDNDGRLVFVGNSLVGIVTRVDPKAHPEETEGWFLEAAFGDLADTTYRVFPSLEAIAALIQQIL